MLPRVSFLLPVYNEQEHLGEALASIAAQDYPADCIEVLVAEGGSTDDTPAVIDEYRGRLSLQVIPNPSQNTAVGRNLCLKYATGDLVLNFSGHAVAEPRMVQTLVNKLTQGPADVVGIGCAIRSSGSKTVVGRVIAAVLRSPLGGGGAMDSSYHAASDCDVRSVAFCLYRRAVVDQIGGFDGAFWCGQDAELNLRLVRAGHRLRFTPDTHVIHYKRRTLGGLTRQMYRYGAARAAIARKIPGSLRAVFLLPALWVLAWVALALGAILSPTVALVAAGCAAAFVIVAALSAVVAGAGPVGVVVGPVAYAIIYTAYGLGFLGGFLSRRGKHQPDAQARV